MYNSLNAETTAFAKNPWAENTCFALEQLIISELKYYIVLSFAENTVFKNYWQNIKLATKIEKLVLKKFV